MFEYQLTLMVYYYLKKKPNVLILKPLDQLSKQHSGLQILKDLLVINKEFN